MADSTPQDSSSFTRAFLPGLILGLVVGGLCGAVLPELVSGPGTVEVGNQERGITTTPRGPEGPDDGVPDEFDEATEALEDAASDAGEAAQDAADDQPATIEETTDPTGEGDDPTSGG